VEDWNTFGYFDQLSPDGHSLDPDEEDVLPFHKPKNEFRATGHERILKFQSTLSPCAEVIFSEMLLIVDDTIQRLVYCMNLSFFDVETYWDSTLRDPRSYLL